MSTLPYVLVVLFGLGDGSTMTMDTARSFSSPLSCSMQAFLENEKMDGRTYICVTRNHAKMLLANNQKSDFPITEIPGLRRAPPEQTAQGNIE